MILVDTNILLRIADRRDPQHHTARSALNVLSARREQQIVVPQNLYEFWAVATRKRGAPPTGRNGLGMTADRASRWVILLQRRFTLLPDRADLVMRWHDLVKMRSIVGVRSHDARLVAAMGSYSIPRLMTFNGGDFKDFDIEVVDPRTV